MSKQVRTLRIGRKIQPKQFESLEIAIEVEDVIEYKTADELNAGIANQTKRVIEDFTQTYESVVKDLGVMDKPVAVTHTTGEEVKHAAVIPPNGKKSSTRSLAPSAEELSDSFFDRI